MSIIAPGTPVPAFSLTREDGTAFTQDDVAHGVHVLVFYPAAFSGVCTDQFQIYEDALGEITAGGATIHGVSCDQSDSQAAFREKLGVTIPQLSDFEPKGEASRAFGAYWAPTGVSHRALVVVRDGVVAWSWEGEHPGILPGVNLVFDGLAAAGTPA
jgi:peroxiredoxin (alkyl hydroperoxide reductase subunit C)